MTELTPTSAIEISDLDGATICVEHIVDDYLRGVAGGVTENSCTFCGRESGSKAFAVRFQPVLACFMDTFWAHNTPPEEAPVFEGDSYGLEWTDTQVGNLAGAAFDDAVVDNVTMAIAESIGVPEVGTLFSEMATDDLELSWADFTETARHVSRFLVSGDGTGRSPMARFSTFLEQLRLFYVDSDHGLVRTMKIDTRVYRGRLVDDLRGKLPMTATALGPAPAGRASASRMSPAGISMFYCSADPITAIAEIAGHGVQPFAVIGEFISRRELRVLDLTEVRAQPSLFDPEHRSESRMLSFLDMFAAAVSRPIIPDQRQHVEYAPTQVLTEFLRWAPERKIDGIQLISSQTGAATYVLFVDAEDIVDVDTFTEPPEYLAQSEGRAGRTLLGITFDELRGDDPEGPTFTLDPERVQCYRVNRRVSPESVAERMGRSWVITKPSRAD